MKQNIKKYMKNGRCDVTQRVETILVNKNKNDVPVFFPFLSNILVKQDIET